MKITKVDIDDLKLDEVNPRLHDWRNLDAIETSLDVFGQQKPIVIDGDNKVIAGNGTLMAAKNLGWVEIEVVKTELCGEEAVAYSVADNRINELSVWHKKNLEIALEKIGDTNAFSAGFAADELELYLGQTKRGDGETYLVTLIFTNKTKAEYEDELETFCEKMAIMDNVEAVMKALRGICETN